jgi:hypothetical protein
MSADEVSIDLTRLAKKALPLPEALAGATVTTIAFLA